MKQTALVTGATSGIGREFADLLAATGCDLVLVARDQARLDDCAASCSARYKIHAQTIAADLSDPASPQAIFDQVGTTPVSILINNAGFGVYGPFAETNLDRELELLQVNMVSLTHLTKLFLKPMLDRREGRILNVASTVAFQPGPRISLYSASKAFVYSFTCALALELKGTGVTATVLCPGGTRTEFQKRAGMEKAGAFNAVGFEPMSARRVAEIGCQAMFKGSPVAVAGWKNKLMVTVSKRLPTLWSARVAGNLNRDR
jgi:short-subunit dehydrogenase